MDKRLMKNRKLHRLLRQFDRKDLDLLDHYLQSPLLGNSIIGRRFLHLYRKLVLDGDGDLEAKAFYEALYPSRTPGTRWPALLNNLQARFLNMVWGFLEFQQFKDNPVAKEMCRMKVREERLGPAHFFPAVGKAWKGLQLEEGFDKLLLEYNFATGWNSYVNENHLRTMDDELEKLVFLQDSLFFMEKLKYACAGANERLSSGREVEIHFVKEICALLHEKSQPWPKIVLAYLHCFEMLNALQRDFRSSFASYRQFRSILSSNPNFSPSESRDLYTYALNYNSFRYNKGHQADQAIAEYKALIDEMIKRELFQENGKMPIIHLKNTVKVMLNWGEVEWVERFLERFRGKVVDDPRGQYWSFNFAVLQFQKREFRATLHTLNTRFFDSHCSNDLYRIGAKIYEIKCLYELGDFELNEARIEALRMELRRKLSIQKELNAIYFKFCGFMRRLNKACQERPARKRKIVEELVAEIEGLKAERQFAWVVEKAGNWIDA